MTVADRTLSPRWRPWLWALWCSALVLATALTIVARWTPYLPGDLALTHLIQSSPFPSGVADALNTIGGGPPATLVVVVVAVAFVVLRRRDLAAVFVAGSVLGLISGPLKILTDRARPTSPLVQVAQTLTDRSFPSGHVLHAVLSFGLLAILVGLTSLPLTIRRPIQVMCVIVVGLMGIARIYVGAHWPSDVLGGYLWGAVILAAILRVARVAPASTRRGGGA